MLSSTMPTMPSRAPTTWPGEPRKRLMRHPIPGSTLNSRARWGAPTAPLATLRIVRLRCQERCCEIQSLWTTSISVRIRCAKSGFVVDDRHGQRRIARRGRQCRGEGRGDGPVHKVGDRRRLWRTVCGNPGQEPVDELLIEVDRVALALEACCERAKHLALQPRGAVVGADGSGRAGDERRGRDKLLTEQRRHEIVAVDRRCAEQD